MKTKQLLVLKTCLFNTLWILLLYLSVYVLTVVVVDDIGNMYLNIFCSGEFRYRLATVIPKCDEKKEEKHEAIFEIIDEDKWVRENRNSRFYGS